MVSVGDEVELTNDRIGKIQYIGPLDGKNGIFYGISLTKGVGKHRGLYHGKQYFQCKKGKGLFVSKKDILYKIQIKTPATNKNKKKKKNKAKKNTTTPSSASSSSKLGKKFRVPRKGGPSDAKKNSKKGSWKPINYKLDDDDGTFMDYKPGRKMKFQQKTKYTKAGYLPPAKFRKKKYKPDDWGDFQVDNNKIKKQIEEDRARIKWEQDQLDANDDNDLDDDAKAEAERKRIALEEEVERLKKLEEERKKKEVALEKERLKLKELEKEKQRLKELEEERQRLKELEQERQRLKDLEDEIERKRKLDEEERRRRLEEQQRQQDALEKEKKRLADIAKKKELERLQREKDKLKKKDYKIFFSVNIQSDQNDDDIINQHGKLRPLLADLFNVSNNKILKIKTKKKSKGFRIEFNIIIAIAMHPADYVETFNDKTTDGSFANAIKNGFNLDDAPSITMWDAKYEKVDPKKQKNNDNL